MSRLLEALKSVPLCTLSLASVCGLLQLYTFLFEADVMNYALSGRAVVYLGEYYRLLTSAFFHGGFQHILFNMMSFTAIGGSLERSLGTVVLLHISLWSVLLGSALFVAIQWTMTFLITGDSSHFSQPAVGFSGAIFALAAVESYRSLQPTRSLFGLFSVPTRIYPWILMALIQFMIPNVSLVGHLAGLLVGLLHAYGSTSFLIPSPAQCRVIEEWGCTISLARQSCFIPHPQQLPNTNSQMPSGNLLAGIRDGIVGVFRAGWWILATIFHIVGIYSPPNYSPQGQSATTANRT